MAAPIAIAAGAVVLAAATARKPTRTAIPKAAAGGGVQRAQETYTVSLPNGMTLESMLSMQLARQPAPGQGMPVQLQGPSPTTAPRNKYVDPAIGTDDKALRAAVGCVGGAVTGAKLGAPLAVATGGLSVPIGAAAGCVAGAVAAWFGDWFNETIIEDKQIEWNAEFAKERVNAGDTLWRQVVKVTDGRDTQMQERIVRESSWPPFIDFELGRRVIG